MHIVYVDCVKVSSIGSDTDRYGIILHDEFDKEFDIKYSSIEDFLKRFPTRDSILDWIDLQDGFEEYMYVFVDDDTVAEEFNDSMGTFAVKLTGYPG